MSARQAGVLGLAAALALVVLALGLRSRVQRDAAAPRPVPSAHDIDRETAGWTGQLELADGSRLVARVVRLHPERERQEFDARALARRLALADGEPWRLDLRRWSARVAAEPIVAIALDALRLEDERGVVLATIAPDTRAPELVPDPLRTLLAPPPEPLAPGQAIELVLWGREPRGAARLTGFAGSLALELEPTRVRRDDVPASLARLDRASPDAATSSEVEPREESR